MSLTKTFRTRFSIPMCFIVAVVTIGISNAQNIPTATPAAMISNSGFEATWFSVAGVNSYELDITTDSTFATKKTFTARLNEMPTDENYFGANNRLSTRDGRIWHTVAELLPATNYYYRVRCQITGVVTPNSNIIKVTTQSHPEQIAPLKWVKTIQNPGEVAEVQSMIGDDDGNIYAAGRFSKTIVAGNTTLTSNGGDDMFIMKLNADGDVLWAKSVGGPGNDGEASLALDSSGLYIVGIFRSTMDADPGPGSLIFTNGGTNPADGFLTKLKSTDGTLLWSKQIVDGLTWSPGAIALDKTGVYIGGYFYGTSTLGTTSTQFASQGENDIFFGKYQLTNGSAVWVKSIGGSNFDGIRAIDVEGDGLFITGFFNGNGDWNTGTVSGAIDFDPGAGVVNLSVGGGFAGRYSTDDGRIVFAKAFNGAGSFMCNPWSIDVHHSTMYLTGNFHGTVNFSESPSDQRTAEDIGAFVSSYSATNGNSIWIKTLQTAHFIHPRKVIADNAGIYVSGGFGQSVNFDPEGSARGNRTSLLGYDNYMARYRPSGIFEWVKTLYVVSIAPAARTSDGYYLGGMFWNTINFDPYLGNATVSPNTSAMFIAKYKATSPPFNPKSITASNVDTTSFTAAWKPMPGASSYSIDVSSDNFNTFEAGYAGLNVTSDTKKVTGLDRGKTYSFRLRSVNIYGESDNSSPIFINTICTAKPTITVDMTNEIAPTLTSSSANGNQWFLNGQPIPDATSQILKVTKGGSYSVQVSRGSCKSEMSEARAVVVTSISKREKPGVYIFPNPAEHNTFLHLDGLSTEGPTEIHILDAMGRQVGTITSTHTDIVPIDLSNYNPGVYMIKASHLRNRFDLKLVKR